MGTMNETLSSSGLLQEALDLQDDREAAAELSDVRQDYDTAFEALMAHKAQQIERIESRLEDLAEDADEVVRKLAANQPGLLSLPGRRSSWSQAMEHAQARAQQIHNRLDQVREIAHGTGLHGPALEDLVRKRLRAEHPELVDAWDRHREEERLKQLQERRAPSRSEAKSQGHMLSRAAPRPD